MVEDGRRPSGGADAPAPCQRGHVHDLPGAEIFLRNGPEMAKKKPLKAAKLVKRAARKTIGQPKATRAERSRIEKFKGGRVSKKKGEETKEYDSHE